MLYRKNLHAWVTAVMFSERDSLLSITIPRFLALGDEVKVVSPSEMEKSEKGEVRAGMKISYILPGLSFRWWLSIQLWMLSGRDPGRDLCQMGERREKVGYHQHNNGMTCHEQK